MNQLSAHERSENIEYLQSKIFDLVIVGGGITGAGVARDAVQRGMSVALVEARDFASGTSSRSSKLIHGGLRYLENMDFGLVFEALSERTKLFEMAPHLVHPLRFVLPLYEGGRVGMTKMGLGMWLYDALSLFQAPQMHERLSVGETLARVSSLESTGLLGSYAYSDAYMDDDRLTIETLRSAVKSGATCVNYVKVEKALFEVSAQNGTQIQDGNQGKNGHKIQSKKGSSGADANAGPRVGQKVKSLLCRDVEGNREFQVRGRHFVSAVGPWTDVFGTNLFKDWKPILRPTKGIHLTLPKKLLPINDAVVMGEGKRIVFAIPRHEMVIVGTTDSDFTGSPDDVTTDIGDVQYLLKVFSQYFPGAKISENDIIATYEGVRPLVNDGAATEGKTSREHTIFSDDRGVTYVAGGKYTTYRLMAEQIVNETLLHFSLEEKVKFNKARTSEPLNEKATQDTILKAQLLTEDWSREFNVSSNIVKALVERHGGEAADILEYGKLFKKRNLRNFSLLQMEAMFAIKNTMCLHLVDFYTRRYPLFLSEYDHGMPYCKEISEIFALEFGWNEAQIEEEKRALANHISHELGWKLNKGRTSKIEEIVQSSANSLS